METLDFEGTVDIIVQLFKDKVKIINELKEELDIDCSFTMVTYVIDGLSPGYSYSLEQMKFAIDIGSEVSIDQYVDAFTEEDFDD